VVSNWATNSGGGLAGALAYNSIFFYNTAPSGSNTVGSKLNNCCNFPELFAGGITNEPLFVDLAGGDFHLQSNSPCINSGANLFVHSTTDLDGDSRIAGGTVDIGAYEFQSPSSLLSYAWAQQYSLPTDGSADFLDSDGDTMNNWQESIAGTNPTNPASALVINTLATNSAGLQVIWQGVIGKSYFVQRALDLSAASAFTTIRSNIYTQDGTLVHLDTTATNGGPYFYRVGVQQ
jgi:hypothetical protein